MLLWMHHFFLNAYMMYVWMIFFFLWENAFMKSWTFSFWKYIYEWMIFLDLFFFSFHMYACIICFWECIYKWNFWKCVYDVRNSRYSQADFVPLKIQAWKSIFYFLSNFPFFLIITWMDARNCNFQNSLMICMNVCSTLYFFFQW